MSRIKFCSLFFVFLVFAGLPAFGQERITSFDVDINVERDNRVVVTEQIDVVCEGRQIRHGIYRDIPVVYRMREKTINANLRILNIEMDGAKSKYHIRKFRDKVRIYIGDPDKYLSFGPHSFKIIYSMDDLMLFGDDVDTLAWNVIGHEWKFSIERSSSRIFFPEGTDIINVKSYVGRFGSKDPGNLDLSISGNVVSFVNLSRLNPGEGITLFIDIPKGIVNNPTLTQRIWRILTENIYYVIGIILFLCSLIVYYHNWKKFGKDEDISDVEEREFAPEGVSPEILRYVRNMGYDRKIFHMAIVELGQKGIIEFRDKKKEGATLKILNNTDCSDCSETARFIFDRLIKDRRFVFLTPAHQEKIYRVEKELMEFLDKKCRNKYFTYNIKYLWPGYLLSLLSMLVVGFNMPVVSYDAFLVFLIFLVAFLVMGMFLVGNAFYRFYNAMCIWNKSRLGKFTNAAMLIVFFFIYLFAHIAFPSFADIFPALFFTTIFLANLLFMRIMSRWNKAAINLLRQGEGFKRAIFAEKLFANFPRDHIHMVPVFFDGYLLWAMALDIEDEWGGLVDRFVEQFYGKMEKVPSPHWYVGPGYHYRNFYTAIDSSMSHAWASPSSSSGGVGGGFSGGGGGGGGGGGW